MLFLKFFYYGNVSKDEIKLARNHRRLNGYNVEIVVVVNGDTEICVITSFRGDSESL